MKHAAFATGALAVLLGLGLLSGCTGEEDDPPLAPVTDISAGSRYVALGDSYTSGPRLGATTGAPGCEQTDGNYPHLLAERLDLELVDVSCGGSNFDHLTESQTPPNGSPVPPQLEAVTEDTALVTLSMGGNEGRVFATLTTTCVGLAVKNPLGAPCSAAGSDFAAGAEEAVDGVAERTEEAVRAIRERAPDARILVVGYPHFLASDEGCRRLPIAEGDVAFAAELFRRVVEAQEEGARASDAEYVDVWTATTGHDICSDDPWVAGIVPTRAALNYHPYAEEQQAVADLLEQQVG